MKAFALRIIKLLFLASIIFSLENLSPKRFWFQEQNLNLAYYYLCAHLISLLLFALLTIARGKAFLTLQRAALAVILCGLSTVYLIDVAPFYIHPQKSAKSSPQPGEGIRVVALFVPDVENETEDSLLDFAARENGDILMLGGVPKSFSFTHAQSLFPFRADISGNAEKKNLVISKFPLSGGPLLSLGAYLPPVLLTTARVNGKPLVLSLLMLEPSLSQDLFVQNELTIRRVASHFRHSQDSVLLGSRLWLTPSSKLYHKLRHGGKLVNASQGFGLFKTWSRHSAFLRFPFDHLFVKGDINVEDIQTRTIAHASHSVIRAVIALN